MRLDGYAQLYEQEFERVARTVYLVLRDAGRAEDVTQEAFVRLYLRWGTVSRYDRPGLWVRRVAIRLAMREARRERLRSLLERRARPPERGTPSRPGSTRRPVMSVDSRLREGLHRSASGVPPGAAGGLEAVVTAARRRRTGRRVAAGAGAVLALAVGVGVVVDRGSQTTAPPPVPAASTSTSVAPTPERVASTDADALLATALVGVWTTGPVTEDVATAAMARTGTLGYREPALAQMPLPGTFTVTFDELAYRAHLDGGSQDEGTWYVRDGRLVLVPSCDHCRVVLAPDIHGGALRLALLEDTSPDLDGVPDAAYATVRWTSAPFRPVPPPVTGP